MTRMSMAYRPLKVCVNDERMGGTCRLHGLQGRVL